MMHLGDSEIAAKSGSLKPAGATVKDSIEVEVVLGS
jgi:hypothetical protein